MTDNPDLSGKKQVKKQKNKPKNKQMNSTFLNRKEIIRWESFISDVGCNSFALVDLFSLRTLQHYSHLNTSSILLKQSNVISHSFYGANSSQIKGIEYGHYSDEDNGLFALHSLRHECCPSNQNSAFPPSNVPILKTILAFRRLPEFSWSLKHFLLKPETLSLEAWNTFSWSLKHFLLKPETLSLEAWNTFSWSLYLSDGTVLWIQIMVQIILFYCVFLPPCSDLFFPATNNVDLLPSSPNFLSPCSEFFFPWQTKKKTKNKLDQSNVEISFFSMCLFFHSNLSHASYPISSYPIKK